MFDTNREKINDIKLNADYEFGKIYDQAIDKIKKDLKKSHAKISRLRKKANFNEEMARTIFDLTEEIGELKAINDKLASGLHETVWDVNNLREEFYLRAA